MSHPACCRNPDTCTLSYKEHIYGFGISATAIPSRAINRTPGHRDESVADTLIREKRWDRDTDAFLRLRNEGIHTIIDGAAARERIGETMYDVTTRPMTIDYTDPT